MGFMKPIAKAAGFGLAGMAASKGNLPLAAISPAAALIRGSKKKKVSAPSLVAKGQGPYDDTPRSLI